MSNQIQEDWPKIIDILINEYDITPGKKIVRPTDPTKQGFSLAGWYTDPDFANPYDFDTVPTDDVMLYAKWTRIEETQTEDTKDETTVPSTLDNIDTYITLAVISSISLVSVLYIKKKIDS